MSGRWRRLVIALVGLLAVAGCGTSRDTTPAAHPSAPPADESRGAVLVVIADRNFSDTEFWTLRDGLVEADYTPVVANASGGDSAGSEGSTVAADLKVGDAVAGDYVAVALIGGTGSQGYVGDAGLHALLREGDANGRPLGAICLAPAILARAGVLEGRKATICSGEEGYLEKAGCREIGTGVVVDGTIVTADGPDSSSGFRDAFLEVLEAAVASPPAT